MHDYFYGTQSEQFTFYRVPTVLFTEEQYKEMSAEAKVLYGILLKRMELSAKSGWLDEKGRVYIIFKQEEIMEKLSCAKQKAVKLLEELESRYGLIERRRQGLGRPNLIYVKNFIDSGKGVSESNFKKYENQTSGSLKIELQEVRKSYPSNRDISYTERSQRDLIYPGSDEMDRHRIVENYFRDAIEYETLLLDYPDKKETIDGILELLTDTCTLNREMIRIAGDDKPREVVRGRLMKINSSCVRYVLRCLEENDSEVKNIRQYLLAALYNAPTTIGPYYQAKVNYDWSGRREMDDG